MESSQRLTNKDLKQETELSFHEQQHNRYRILITESRLDMMYYFTMI